MMIESNKMKLISGRDIRNNFTFRKPYPQFWKKVKRNGYSRKTFRKFIEDSQEFFSAYERGEDCSNIWIPTTENRLADAMYVYCHIGNCVMAEKTKGGYKIVSGFHRAYVAKKYHLNLLVYVIQDDEE